MESAYHHGSLREALIADGRRLLVQEGVDGVTLRELARRAGVSHGAPRRHFADRDELLAAIAARGFEELTAALRFAAEAEDRRARLRRYFTTYVEFAVNNGPLVALMFGSKPDRPPVQRAASEFFALGAQVLGEAPGDPPGPLVYVAAAAVEGIGALVTAGRLPEDRVGEVIDAAVSAVAGAYDESGPTKRV
ncbi:TetR/AcrR family transcriptional regulator [Leifsonia sp. AG29]|uniref:TetR/AcrR family transcriptional regulator n=1 Tax=Leifsonia sp. AG29 TaxID=2598860 RepID=UPI00131BF0E3|nr:TetR/AcrR family transcriptional regulator [Leifsonia sp. AG29]